jgi:hypothetical protein
MSIYGLDSLLANLGTLLFWLSVPAILHLCLKGKPRALLAR